MLRLIFYFLLGFIFYKFFQSFVDKKKAPVKGVKKEQSDAFQKKYKNLIEDAEFEEYDESSESE